MLPDLALDVLVLMLAVGYGLLCTAEILVWAGALPKDDPVIQRILGPTVRTGPPPPSLSELYEDALRSIWDPGLLRPAIREAPLSTYEREHQELLWRRIAALRPSEQDPPS